MKIWKRNLTYDLKGEILCFSFKLVQDIAIKVFWWENHSFFNASAVVIIGGFYFSLIFFTVKHMHKIIKDHV